MSENREDVQGLTVSLLIEMLQEMDDTETVWLELPKEVRAVTGVRTRNQCGRTYTVLATKLYRERNSWET